MVAPVRIVQRSAYQDAQGLGLGVTEYEPERKSGGRDQGAMELGYAQNGEGNHESETNVA